jgi:hypothetical protein
MRSSPYYDVVGAAKEQELIRKWISTLPNKFDCIIGIPRAGLVEAAAIATSFARPLSVPELFTRGIVWWPHGMNENVNDIQNVLVVDDTCGTGRTMLETVKLLRDYRSDLEIHTASLQRSPASPVEYSMYVQDGIQFMHDQLENQGVAMDMDGILCEDWHEDLRLQDFLRNAHGLFIPKFRIGAIITGRLERYRDETEKWLRKNGVRYDKLLMWNGHGSQLDFKCKSIVSQLPECYWESNSKMARDIHRRCGVPVLSFEEMRMFR